MRRKLSTLLLSGLVFCGAARADELPDWLSLHGQSTLVEQYHPAFHSLYRGPNSLSPKSVGNETFDATVFLGVRLWHGGALYADPEVDQGFGLSNTLGVAAFPSGEAYKVGDVSPYVRVQRLFFRQSFDLGGDASKVDGDANQVEDNRTADNLILTIGKFSVGDVFDTNTYAHDPRGDFLNWAVIDAGAFDYAADSWGYTSGASAELTLGRWTARAGLFNLSKVPNGLVTQNGFGQFEAVGEVEERHKLFGEDKIKLLFFLNRGRMGSYRDALASSSPPDTALVRRYASKPGGEINLEQGVTDDLGVFLRASANDGGEEAYEFTEINRSLSAGLSLKGSDWQRPKDTLGLALVVDGLSRDARDYFAAGGMGILIGDGHLRYSSEDVAEAFYSAAIADGFAASADYQFIAHPAYNRDRGPVSVFSARLHAAF